MTAMGRVPQGWKVVQLRDLTTYEKGRRPPSVAEEKRSDALPYLTVETLRTRQFNRWASDGDKVIVAKPDDIIMIWDGFNSGSVFSGLSGILGSTAVKLMPKHSDVDTRFLFYFLAACFKELNSKTAGMYLKHVSKTVFESLEVGLPPLPEQRKIATTLATVDDSIQKIDEIIAKTQQLKKGLMQRLLTKGIGHTRFKLTEIGEIPEDWRVVTLRELTLKVKRGPSKRTNGSGIGVIYLTSDYIDDDGNLSFDNLSFLDESQIDDLDKYLLHVNDLVVNCVNSSEKIGKVALFKGHSENVMIGFNNFALTPRTHAVNPEYLKYSLSGARGRKILRNLAKPAVQQVSFSSEDLLKLELPLPRPLEQQRIALILLACDERIGKEKARRRQLEHLKKGLMQVLLTGKVRVKVN